MGMRHPNWRLVKKRLTYTIQELADLLHLHKNTVRDMRRNGLRPIDDHRPVLFLGCVVVDFLRERRITSKRPLKPGEMYCLRCREARLPAFGDIEFLPITPSSGNLRGLCPTCSALMHRRISLPRLHLMPINWQTTVRLSQGRLKDCGGPSLNCDFGGTTKR